MYLNTGQYFIPHDILLADMDQLLQAVHYEKENRKDKKTKESTWLKNYEHEVNGKRQASNSKKKVILIIVPLMMLLCLGLAAMNRNTPAAQNAAAQGQNAVMYIVPTFAVLMVFILIMLAVGKKKDVTKFTRENVKSLLRTDEEVDAFDQQMSETPIREVKINSTSTVFLTPDYVGQKGLSSTSDLTYAFMRRK